jgi:subtilisin
MNIKKTSYLAIILLLLFAAQFASATSEDTRYFVKSTSGWWKKSFGVRHNFDNGFTTDLSDSQLWVAKFFGVTVEPVKKLNVLPDVAQAPVVSGKITAQRVKPSEQIPWGVRGVYNDSLLVKSIGGSDVNVAILDTGVLKTHPDLKDRIKDCKDFSGAAAVITGKCDDKNGHGTHVAGIIAADGGSDGLGIYGMAPEANLFAYKVCSNNGTCWADDIAVALRIATDEGANIINMSLGSDAPSQLITDATDYAVSKKVLVVAAAGNDGSYTGSIDYPGADASVIAVGAVDKDVQIPDWSSRGINSTTKSYVVEAGDIELVAPGLNIESTWKDGGYAILSGTSMASPHVAGLAAKLWQKDALNPASETRELLQKLTADLLPIGDDNNSGFGFPHL